MYKLSMFKFLVFLCNPNSYRLCVYQTLKTMCEYFKWLSTLSSLPINVFFYMYEMIHTLNENYWYKTYHSGFIGIFCNFGVFLYSWVSFYLNFLKILMKLQQYWFSDFCLHTCTFQNELTTPLWQTNVVKPLRLFKCLQSGNSYVDKCFTLVLSWVRMSEGEQQERNFSFSVNPMPDQAVTNLISQLISQHGATTLTHHLPHHLLRGAMASGERTAWREPEKQVWGMKELIWAREGAVEI